MLRSLPKVSRSSALFAQPASRASSLASSAIASVNGAQQQRHISPHAISNPTLASIEKRWEQMPPQEQADLWMSLRDRMRSDWHQLTVQERKAAYWIAFGNHGPRAVDPPGEGWRIVGYVTAAVGATLVLFFGVRAAAGPAPRTMNREWQEATNEYLKGQNAEPMTGLSSEGYVGEGQIQSKPKKPE